jgi:hypothetical protein
MGGPPFQAWSFRDVNKVWIQYNDYFEQHWIVINASSGTSWGPSCSRLFRRAATSVEHPLEPSAGRGPALSGCAGVGEWLEDHHALRCRTGGLRKQGPRGSVAQVKEMLGDEIYNKMTESVKKQ